MSDMQDSNNAKMVRPVELDVASKAVQVPTLASLLALLRDMLGIGVTNSVGSSVSWKAACKAGRGDGACACQKGCSNQANFQLVAIAVHTVYQVQ